MRRSSEVHEAARREQGAVSAAAPTRDFSRRRALVLALVHVAIAAHVVHWRLAGRTLAPLELNEVVYTAAAGVVTAGFLFMALICAATAVVGRFFCSWGCHLLALQDLCAWLLGRVGIVPRPFRSRVLRWVAPLAALYMFVAPAAYRLATGRGAAELHTRGDAEGWASFVTDDFWRNLPGPGVAIATFAVCGFAIVYVLGSRSFCSEVCPYGAVFALLDRGAAGRIVARGDCSGCGHCTAACQSHVRVHAELAAFGTVVDPACQRDLDCVAACPEGRLAFGFTRPPLLRSWAALRGLPRRWDVGERGEAGLAIVFVAAFLALRGLYGLVPLLLALAAAAILTYGAARTVQLLSRSDLRLHGARLRRNGRLTRAAP
jgi:ferredoxin